MKQDIRSLVWQADKFVRDKTYNCLFPACSKRAVQCHSIQRAVCADALATNGRIITVRQSYMPLLKGAGIGAPMEMVQEGVNRASTFPGFCGGHDTELFSRAEGPNLDFKRGTAVAFHLRAIALEYCRQRRTSDFENRLALLVHDHVAKQQLQEAAQSRAERNEIFNEIYLGNLFGMFSGKSREMITAYRILFSRNLEVSCCGTFAQRVGTFDSCIGYNLISHKVGAALILTTFRAVDHHLRDFVASYGPGVLAIQTMLNEIVFAKNEEPLIAPRLWERLSPEQRHAVGLSLRHPSFTAGKPVPQVIKLAPGDIVPQKTPPATVTFGPNKTATITRYKNYDAGQFAQIAESETITLDIPDNADHRTAAIAAMEYLRPDMRGRFYLKSQRERRSGSAS